MERDGEAMGMGGTLDAANLAREAGAKRLVLSHTGAQLSQPGSREKSIADIARVYAGDIVFGEELMSLDLG
jgi:ribonuclease BN (tRNA processing enzyme)